MRVLERFKKDMVKHPAKAVVLGVLTAVMIAFSIKAAVELHPQGAAASVISQAANEPAPIKIDHSAGNGQEAITRINESNDLWRKLEEVKPDAIPAVAAFTFDASFFPPPAEIHRVTQAPADPAPVKPTVDLEAARIARIQLQAQQLVVRSTAVGNGSTPAVAIVNQQLLSVGQTIMGFEIVAIRPREVDFRRDGVTVSVKMSDDTHGL